MSQSLWQGSFGDRYTARNRVEWQARMPFWRRVLALTRPQSVLEVGCNAGWNLRAIRALDPSITVLGIDVNERALEEARDAGLEVESLGARAAPSMGVFDLVFSCGVLIHIPPAEIKPVMDAIAEASRRWVVAVEYAGEAEEDIPYRGLRNALWKRPYGALYQEMGLALADTGTLDKASGFDDCTFWVLGK